MGFRGNLGLWLPLPDLPCWSDCPFDYQDIGSAAQFFCRIPPGSNDVNRTPSLPGKRMLTMLQAFSVSLSSYPQDTIPGLIRL